MKTVDPRAVDALSDAVREIQYMILPDAASPTDSPGKSRGFVIGITAPTAGVGRSMLATALAATLSDDLGTAVALIDADFATHSLDEGFGLSGKVGLTDALRGDSAIDEVCHRVSDSALRVVPVGTAAADASRIARSAHAADFVSAVREANRFVVIDLPPVLTASMGPVFARLCDGVVIVARSGHTTKVELERTAEKLRGVHIYGVVLNRWRTRIPRWLEGALALRR